MSQHNIERLENTIEEAKKSIKLMKELENLSKHKSFKAVIEKELFEDYNQGITFLLAEASPEMRNQLHEEQYMIAHFRAFLSSIYQKGRQAQKDLIDNEQTLEELRFEEGDE
jgi:hypothetical protein